MSAQEDITADVHHLVERLAEVIDGQEEQVVVAALGTIIGTHAEGDLNYLSALFKSIAWVAWQLAGSAADRTLQEPATIQ